MSAIAAIWIATTGTSITSRTPAPNAVENGSSVPAGRPSVSASAIVLLQPELGLEDVIDSLRIGLAAGLLHDLADEPTQKAGLGFDRRDLPRVAGNDLIDDLFDSA